MSVMTFEWVPDPKVYANKFLTVADALETTRAVPLAAASEQMQTAIQERFDTKTDPQGVPWPRWSFSYLASHFAPLLLNLDGILVRTGALRKAAVSTEAMTVTNDTLFYQTELLPNYGLAHDQGLPDRAGGWSGRNPLPRRSFLGMDDESALRILGFFSEWFDRSIDLFVTSTGKVAPRHRIRGFGGMFIPRSAVGKGPLPKF